MPLIISYLSLQIKKAKKIRVTMSIYTPNPENNYDSLFECGDFNLKIMILLLMIKQWLPESLPELSYKTTHNNRSLKA